MTSREAIQRAASGAEEACRGAHGVPRARDGGARRRTRVACLALAGVALLALPARGTSAAPEPKRAGVRPVTGRTFPLRHAEYETLVAEGGEAALSHLVNAYRRRDLEPTERGRIVTLVCDGLAWEGATAALRVWRETDDGPDDAWLWYRTLRREIGVAGPDGAWAAARDARRLPALRAAAIRALAAWSDPGLPAFVASAAKGDLGRDPARGLLVEALADALASQPGRVGDPAVRDAFQALVPFLRRDAAHDHTRLAVAKSFARLLDTPRTTFDPGFYEALMDRLASLPNPEDDRYAAPRFFGLEGRGDRIVYVIDESGSMKAPLTTAELKDLREGASGAAGGPQGSLPWERIVTRMDAAIEFTKASVRALPETAGYAVLVFAAEVRWLHGTPELLPATRANVAATLKALEGERLTGSTNLHGALRRAFDARWKWSKRRSGTSSDAAESFLGGPTTLFLLSDGGPTANDWSFTPLSRAGGFHALYEERASILDDVERMNLALGCEVNAVGIGEFEADLLEGLVRVGGGRLRRVGGSLLRDIYGEGSGPSYRRMIEMARRLGVPVDPGLERLAREADGGGADAPAGKAPVGGRGAPPTKGPTKPSEDRRLLRESPDAFARLAAVGRLERARHSPAVPDLVRALFEDAEVEVRRACDEALRTITGRGFGWSPALSAHERTAVRRNWDAWWELHREAVLEGEGGTSGPSDGAGPGGTPGGPAPGK